MTTVNALSSRTVAISVSESPDMAVLGFGDEHLHEAFGDLAMYLLADGANLAYGGDLRKNGFKDLLFELLHKYRSSAKASSNAAVTDYLAWPVHIQMSADEIDSIMAELYGHTRIELIGQNGERISDEERRIIPSHEPDDREWSEGLTAMRRVMCAETDARIVLGGAITNYKGRMPGIAEEVLLSLEQGRPVYLIGGFGGCAREIAESLGLADAWPGSRPDWSGRRAFETYDAGSLNNGLGPDENRLLAMSPHISQATVLIMRGLFRLQNRAGNDATWPGMQNPASN